ncbi:serine hydrolase domain-containing protein [Sphingosinicella sp. LY1275]|uniref:serine hydrolase domain-containing protein n=1 Tax=Sphingosinicella sp. LY1275 TaxID=3095379 RepID=UPI002ADEE201|nr:serine hydrolase domain-containing protein [Sphingosinicella sp. LY1275]MEA1013362.1 serine hydrolase domain-containing protein [Sphingosinicella sp. LY1275]
MLKLFCAALLALVALPAVAQPVPDRIAAAVPEIDRLFADFHQTSHAPGLVYGIVADGRLVHVRAFGVQDLKAKRPVTQDSLFRIASMSKAFTALAVLKLRDDGKLALDDLAEKHVPELRSWRYPTSDSPRIRVRDLLNHTAGFVTDDPWGDRQQVMTEAAFTAMLKQGVPFTRAPGTAFEYSNFGYALLGRIVTNVSGMPYDRYIATTIQRPLGMASTGYEVRDWPLERRAIGYRWENEAWSEEPTMRHGVFGAMGGVQTSASDYAKWMGFLLSAWPARDGAEAGPVRRATVREMAQGSNFARLRQRFGTSPVTQASAYGMGLIAAQDPDLGATLSHGGGYPGYGSHMLLLTDHGVGVFVFSNRTYNGGSGAAWDAAMVLHKAGALVARPQPVSASLATAYRAAGEAFAAGDIAPARKLLAMNFLMDRSADNWRRELARLKKEVGECDTAAPIIATGALSGTFQWRCATGRLDGTLLLAPTDQAGIQALRLSIAAP